MSDWAIDDEVMQLRVWGSARTYALPAPPTEQWTVGVGDACHLRLEDPSGRVSRVHAQLVRSGRRWVLHDLNSRNGSWIDGARRAAIIIEPGSELGIGGVTLIAESPRSVALAAFLARLLGWRDDRRAAVDHAMRAIRMGASRRHAITLCGEGDLVPIAYAIHRHALGIDRPFIVCDPRRRDSPASVRSAENHELGISALAVARGGSLCVRSHRLPRDFDAVIAALRDPQSRIQLMMCAHGVEASKVLAVPIAIPPLASRADEIDRIITEFADDAIAELDAQRGPLTDAERAWVRDYSARSIPDIEKATLRLIALREARTLTSAAERLGMAPVSLSRWIGRRSQPPPGLPASFVQQNATSRV